MRHVDDRSQDTNIVRDGEVRVAISGKCRETRHLVLFFILRSRSNRFFRVDSNEELTSRYLLGLPEITAVRTVFQAKNAHTMWHICGNIRLSSSGVVLSFETHSAAAEIKITGRRRSAIPTSAKRALCGWLTPFRICCGPFRHGLGGEDAYPE
jgi:hypothetical protein